MPKDHLFKPGNSGRKKGATNKVNRLVKDLVSDVFNKLQENQDAKAVKADLYSWAKAHPRDFYQIAAKLIPVQMEHSGEMGIVWNEVKNYDPKQKADNSSRPS